jgi:hypothetical protein
MKALSALFFLLFLLSFSLNTKYYKMTFQTFYEDRHGNAVDECGRPEPMDYIIDEERYALETVSSHTQYLHNQPQENNFDVGSMTDEDAEDDVDVCMKEASSKRAYTLYGSRKSEIL